MKSVCSPGRQGEARGLFGMQRDGTSPRLDIVCGVQAALREVRLGQTGLSLLWHWVWMHKRVKKSETERRERERCWMMCISCGTQVTSHALKLTQISSTHIHSCAIHSSIRSSLHHLIIHPIFGSRLMGLSPADRTFPGCGANISHYGACNVGITPLFSMLSAPTWQLHSTDGTSSLKPPPLGLLLYESQITFAGLQ